MRDVKDRDMVMMALLRLFVAFPQWDQTPETSALRLEVYTEALTPYTGEEIEAAARQSIAERGRRVLPTAGELIDVILEGRLRHRREADSEARAQRQLTEDPAVADAARAEFKALVEQLAEKFRPRPAP